MIKYCFSLAFILIGLGAQAQNRATIKEFKKVYTTYPFSDPDPIPSAKKIYPYFRFDGFSHQGIEQEWKVVLLENDYISVQVMPEIGGKVWTATDKVNGKDFLYNNEVVKFRDIAMRGPWVSGGIEANYGVIGHTPNTSTPVDYLVRENEDGSVSCFISTLDLLTRTRWVLEIKLEKDKAYFTTRSFWFNSTGVEQPYYTWMNAGIPVGEKLRFLYPGSHSISHGGRASEWPMDDAGRNLAYYEENDFGGSKSYHILGEHSKYFGAIWEADDFGMIRYSKREDKLGKKIFLWAQSESGRIWEDLLTDNSGQYVEIQSGRLFNQNQFQSSFTPFKQIGFEPYTSENWIEYWYPFKGTNGFTSANLTGAFNVERSGKSLTIQISPVQVLEDSLYVYNQDGGVIAGEWIKADPLESVKLELAISESETVSSISIKGERLDFGEDKTLSRPTETEDGFEMDGSYGLYLQGRDLAGFRQYQEAEEKIDASLQHDPFYLPALVEKAKLKLFRIQYDSAFYFSKKALAIDTYDAAANYYYGKAASYLSRKYDALDGFEVATLTPQFRNASYTALADEYMKEKDWAQAREYARLSLSTNTENIHALQILYLIARLEEDQALLEEVKGKIDKLNPLNHFLRFEDYLQEPSKENEVRFAELIRNEMPVETYLELAIWYANLKRFAESRKVLELAPENTETLFWLAWLTRENTAVSKGYLAKASASNPGFVFPFREETAAILEWAADRRDSWQADYLLALIHEYRGNSAEALKRLKDHGNEDGFAPFYVLRARLWNSDSLSLKLGDMNTALDASPKEWRYRLIKSSLLVELGRNEAALQTLEDAYKANRENYIVGLDLVRLLIRNNDYAGADKVLSRLRILPFEGATEARRFYRETKLMLAHAAMERKRFKEALARIEEAKEWPNRLGVGKPYPTSINEDLENWMTGYIYLESGEKGRSQEYFEQVKNKEINEETYLDMITAISSRADRRLF